MKLHNYLPLRTLPALLFFVLMLACHWGRAEMSSAYRKPDIDSFFDKLEAGRSVTVVTLGGSITMAPGGWSQQIVKMMREAYPKANVNFVNAGISGTGSDFGLFRLDRDVIEMNPDLVVIEFAVNDGGTPDETCLRNLESIVTRLQSLPSPPAIVFLESAAQRGANHARHSRVANHYGLLNVHMQPVVNIHLARNGGDWSSLFRDQVHPNASGHELYAKTLWNSMLRDRELPTPPARSETPPRPLSQTPLILDGSLIVPNYQMVGWDYLEEDGQIWWRKFFQGSLQNRGRTQPLVIPFYGRTLGVALLTTGGSGKVSLSVDGTPLKEMDATRPNGFYNIYVLPELLSEDWHMLRLTPVPGADQPANIRIGYLLMQQQRNAPLMSDDFWENQ